MIPRLDAEDDDDNAMIRYRDDSTLENITI